MGKLGIELQDILGIKTPENVAEDLMSLMKRIRKNRKWSRKELSLRSGVPEATIRYAENTGKISLTSLLHIADALDMLDCFEDIVKRPNYKRIEDV